MQQVNSDLYGLIKKHNKGADSLADIEDRMIQLGKKARNDVSVCVCVCVCGCVCLSVCVCVCVCACACV